MLILTLVLKKKKKKTSGPGPSQEPDPRAGHLETSFGIDDGFSRWSE
jgi:hypothetical protein